MKKRAVAAVVAAFACAALLTAALLFARSDREVPEFTFSEPPAGALSAEPADTSAPELSPEETAQAEISEEAEPTFPAAIVTSNNPDNRSTITFDGFDIIIEGTSENGYVLEACLFSDSVSTSAEYEGSHYVIALRDKRPESGYDGYNGYETLYVYNSDNSGCDYRIRVSPDGYEPIDTSSTAANNLRLAEAPVALPHEGVLQYITPGGDPDEARKVMERAKEISDKICEDARGDYEKAFAISRWVSDNIYYDYDASEAGVTAETLSLSHVLETHRTVCGGYSNLFAALCSVQGIKTVNIRGEAINDVLCSFAETDVGELHEWNCAYIDGRAVWVDAGWNSYNVYKNGKYKHGGTGIKYFDPTNEVLSYDHRARIAETRDYSAALR